jgi:hypothetical protein
MHLVRISGSLPSHAPAQSPSALPRHCDEQLNAAPEAWHSSLQAATSHDPMHAASAWAVHAPAHDARSARAQTSTRFDGTHIAAQPPLTRTSHAALASMSVHASTRHSLTQAAASSSEHGAWQMPASCMAQASSATAGQLSGSLMPAPTAPVPSAPEPPALTACPPTPMLVPDPAPVAPNPRPLDELTWPAAAVPPSASSSTRRSVIPQARITRPAPSVAKRGCTAV